MRTQARVNFSGLVRGPSGISSREFGEPGRGADDIRVCDDVQQRDGIRGECGLQRWREVVEIAYGVAVCAQAPGVTCEVHLPYLDAGRAAEISLLVHRYGAVHPVTEDDDDDSGTVADCRLDLVARHEEPAVAAAGHDGPVRCCELRSYRGWNTIAHRAVRRGQLRVRVVVAPVAVDEDREVPGIVRQQHVRR